jgi:hypothetical protein
MNKRILAIVGLIFAAAFLRLIPHAPNFSPIGAIALFGGAYLGRSYLAYLVPIIAMLISDLFLGFYGLEMLVTYGAIVGAIFIGTQINNNLTWYKVAMGSVGSSILFFLITNCVFFYPASMGNLYTNDFAGLMSSYIAGIPFFQNTFASDLVYNTLLFGSFYLMSINIPSLKLKEVKA